jgi:hypothetical protein
MLSPSPPTRNPPVTPYTPNPHPTQARFNLGLLPEDAIIADRAFNTRASSNAYLQDPSAVRSVAYDPRAAPDRLTVEFQRVAADMQPLPPKRVEIYIQNM